MSKNSAVIPIIVGNSNHALLLAHKLFEMQINVQPILYPAVPDNASRLRFFITCDHTEDQMKLTVELLAKILKDIRSNFK
jgi:7-keto-8-aminopelargonate synthetase-like enzyme